MNNWKNLKINSIAKIEKCEAEFDVWEFEKTPYAKFKVKIFEDTDGKYVGYTNLKIKDADGCPFGGVGFGQTTTEALKNTILNFLEMLNEKEEWKEEEFECADPYDF